jgi:hypothetical protein
MKLELRSVTLAVVFGCYAGAALAEEVTCESVGRDRKECPMDTRGEIRLVRQLSKAPCTDGVTWGYSKHAVWVEQGCRAVFSSGGGMTEPQGAGSGGIPIMNATCGPGIEVHADEHGPVYIDGREASLKKFNDNYFEARDAQTGAVISITRNADETMGMSYTGAHGENGNCSVR